MTTPTPADFRKKKPRAFSNDYTHRWNVHEEIANSITHGIGVLLGIAALVLMVINASDHHSVTGIVAGAIFGTSLIFSYLSSMIYHAVCHPKSKRFFRIMDHVCIFLLIAGSYTPFALITLHGALGWTMFGVVWTIALIGTVIKFYFVDRYELLSTLLYLGMGWVAMSVSVQLIHYLPLGGLIWLAIGGLAYTFGVIFFLMERIPFFHTIWHLFVLLGSISHFFAILFYVMPVRI
jgi:hemolysin III